jgi:adenine-specific DNA-methyltransferase
VKGFVPTPRNVVDSMIAQLFRVGSPVVGSTVLEPGCGTGAFIEGVIRWCHHRSVPLPHIVGIESDPRLVTIARENFRNHPQIEIRHEDFLLTKQDRFDFIVGNPPYVPITGLSEDEKSCYRQLYRTAQGRFDLYLLFFEQALRSLAPGGRLVFITPEKFLYVDTAKPLRQLLSHNRLEEIRLVDEQTFDGLVTYPTVTTLVNEPPRGRTRIILRDGKPLSLALRSEGRSWLPLIHGVEKPGNQVTLADICRRVSCGVATGADAIFVRKTAELDSALAAFAYPTIAGRELGSNGSAPKPRSSMLVPYSPDGELLAESGLGALGKYLSQRSVKQHLLRRTCVKRKPWYAFHETPPLADILRPKILCKDIAAKPRFWTDKAGHLIPRHSLYYIVPKRSEVVAELCDYLNSETARSWLNAHCQRAASSFLRVQSNVLKRLPIPRRSSWRMSLSAPVPPMDATLAARRPRRNRTTSLNSSDDDPVRHGRRGHSAPRISQPSTRRAFRHDNVNPPHIPRQNSLGIDVDAEYRTMLDQVCKAYTARWHL